MRLAYLCNLYPAVSHSFVRREIEGVEHAGHEVCRFSLRPALDDLRDEADLREAARTQSILGQGAVALMWSAVGLALARPLGAAHSLAAALRLSAPGFRSKFLHLALLAGSGLARLDNACATDRPPARAFRHEPCRSRSVARAWGGPPFSFTAHGPDEFDAPISFRWAARSKGPPSSQRSAASAGASFIGWCDPTQWGKINVIRCGLHRDYLDQPVQPIARESDEFVCVARLSAQKGLPLLIAACDRLRREDERFMVTIVGDGELRDVIKADIDRRAAG